MSVLSDLDSWEFRRTAGGAVLQDWTEIVVPHAALGASGDVRAGGIGHYRSTLALDDVRGDELIVFDGVSIGCRVRVNGITCGEHDGAWDRFEVAVGDLLCQGDNLIEVDVDLPDYDPASPHHFRAALLGFVPDTMGPFAGIWRPVRLERARALRGARARGDADGIVVKWPATPGRVTVRIEHEGVVLAMRGHEALDGTAAIALPDAPRWSPANPVLLDVRIALHRDDRLVDEWSGRTGLRAVSVDGPWITVDEQRVHLRGMLHWGHYPDRAAPSPTAQEARSEIELLRSLGFNMVKFCLWMPPDHYLDLCDELGMIVWQELPLWLPRPGEPVESRVRDQYPALVEAVARHPSVTIVSLGCELDDSVPTQLLDEAYDIARLQLPGVVICANSGSGECFGGGEDARTDIDDYHFYADVHHLEQLIARFTTARHAVRPWVFGEYNDADTWRDASAFSTDPLPAWLSPDETVNPLRSVHAGFASDQPVYSQDRIVAEQGFLAERPGLTPLSEAEAWAKRRLTFETTRCFEEVTGYVMTVLRDVPVTTSGLLDDAGRLKVDADAFRAVNADVVLSLVSPLGRRWVHGGDRLQVGDPFNFESGREHAFALVVGNSSARAGEARLTVAVEAHGRVLFQDERDVNVTPWSAREAATLRLTPPGIANRTVEGVVTARLEVGGEVTAVNSWPVLLHPAVTPAETLLLDPAEILGDWGDEGVRRVTARELHAAARSVRHLVVTRFDDDVANVVATRGLRTFAIHDGAFLPATRGPFWRENVKRVSRGGWAEQALPSEHVGEWGAAIASDAYLPRDALRSVVPKFRPILTRYDARTYRVGEYLVEWEQGAGVVAYSTLSHGAGTGTQPRTADDNVVGRRLIRAFLDSSSTTRENPGAMQRW